MLRPFIYILLFGLFASNSYAKDYDASFFGIESNGIKLNTTSIQKAIDFIHEEGGGRLVFHVGRYLTGSFYLKSNVTLHLKEGAVLMGSLNPFDYQKENRWTALIFAIDQDSIGITGKGIIDGRGYQVAQNMISFIHRGVIKDPHFKNDRPHELIRPQNIYFIDCNQITIRGIQIKNSASWTQQYLRCKNLLIDDITVDSKNYWNNDGADIVDCDSVIIRNSFFDSADDGICLKSHYPDFLCQNILIHNNTIRSSASAIKFGTFSIGGFKNVKIINNKVYDTYRSAITLGSVDGGPIENVVVDSLTAINTGNIIFLRIGERKPGRNGGIKNISISNVYAEVAATKADKGYPYEGPVEHLPRNISPSAIAGLPDNPVQNVTLKNIEIVFPGGADPNYAKVDLDELDNIPELADKYPEFSMFKELPAWGFYIRHVQDLAFENVQLKCRNEDYRMPIVLDDVQRAFFKKLYIEKEGKRISMNQDNIYSHRSAKIKIKD